MKKALLFAVALCCMLSASAQHFTSDPKTQKSWRDKIKTIEQLNRDKNNFTEKLDSITAEETRILFDYDSHFNCTQMYSYYYSGNSWQLDMGYDYTYDEQDRVTSMVTYSYNESPSKEEYGYNEQNLIEEQLYYDWWSDTWHLTGKEVIEYDDFGNILSSQGFSYENDIWTAFEKTIYEYENGLLVLETSYLLQVEMEPYHQIEYNYNSLGLCSERIESHWFGEWDPWEKVEYYYNGQALCSEEIAFGRADDEWVSIRRYTYEYDNRGNCVLRTFYNHYDNSPDWINSDKDEYFYDDNDNCITHNSYYYDDISEEWELDYWDNLTYDLTSDANAIAGLQLIWEELKEEFLIETIHNKLEQIVMYGDYTVDFHYSSTIGLNESVGSKLALWPNPTTGSLSLNGDGLQQVEIFSMDGRQVMHLENSVETINVSALAKGCYLLKATFVDGSKAMQKFVKE